MKWLTMSIVAIKVVPRAGVLEMQWCSFVFRKEEAI
jgi:hypothetical protein